MNTIAMESVEKPKTIEWADELDGFIETHALGGEPVES
jgi:hypothetical protein